MHCSNCGTVLPPGVANCPVCGAPTPYPPGQQNLPSYDPTIVAPPYGTQQNVPQSTAYGTDPYTVQQQGGTPPNPYGGTEYVQPFGQPPPPNYGAYPPINQPPPNYGYPAGQPQGGYPVGVPPLGQGGYGMVPAQQPKKRSRVGMIIGIVVGALLLLCIGGAILVSLIVNQAGKVVSTTATKVAGQTNTPSGKSVVPSAAAIISNPQTSDTVDSNFAPTHVTSTFTPNQKIYVTFDINSGNQDGYIEAKWYADGQAVSTLSFHHNHVNGAGYFSNAYTSSTQNGAVELYWCTKADCSDAQLAQVVHLTVTSTSLVPTHSNLVFIQAVERRTF